MGFWGQKWVESQVSLKNLDPSLLMWDMRRSLDTKPLPGKRCVVLFLYSDPPNSKKRWWLIVEPHGEVDLCSVDPGFDVDLYVTTDLRTMTAIWIGLDTVSKAIGEDKLTLTGDKAIESVMQVWLGLSPFAKERKRVA